MNQRAQHSPIPSIVLGIVAHVDAGKTSLTERLLADAGVIDAPGSVDAGTTRTDSLDLERRRGITIRAAVTSFSIATDAGGVQVNLLDTPGHPDFIAEVERSLTVLDAAVLVLSAVEGVQPQTVAIWRALRRIGLPTVLFVNKVDRRGADLERVLAQVRRRLTPAVVPLTSVAGSGRADVTTSFVGYGDERLIEAAAGNDDRVLGDWVESRAIRPSALTRALRQGVARGELFPVLAGSAITGAGTEHLREVIATLLPRGPVGLESAPSGTVFAVDRDGRGRRAWIRMWSGELRLRDRVAIGATRPTPVTELAVSRPEGLISSRVARPGEIAIVRGPDARVGDALGVPPRRRTHSFPPATMQAQVEPIEPTRRGALFAGLAELADEDPLIDLHLDRDEGEAVVSLHGEVQKEVLAALLEERWGVGARFSDTTVRCLERVRGTGASVDRIKQRDNPYLATVGLRIEPAPVGRGVQFCAGTQPGRLPPAFVAATEEGVRAALRQGLSGWPVTDCVVTMTDSGYYPRQSRPHQKFDKSMSTVAADFRYLAPVVLFAALARAGTTVCQPIERFELELPTAALAGVTACLGRLSGIIEDTRPAGDTLLLTGLLPTAGIPDLTARLPDLTSGEGVFGSRLDHHARVPADPPTRRRTGRDPLDRTAWFRDVTR